ncbi:MAG: DUF2203 domain-containing protein [Planctomycetes bacterium]|nr:DUF2203 domain-containing protein [Planctomycetota bacterium]
MIQIAHDHSMPESRELRRFEEAKRMLPLLRSYAQEIVDRRHRVVALQRADAGSTGAGERSTHLNELRRVERELERLGWYVGEEDPPYFYRVGKDGEPDLAWAPFEATAP